MSENLGSGEFLCRLKNRNINILRVNECDSENIKGIHNSSLIRLEFVHEIFRECAPKGIDIIFILNLHDCPPDGLNMSRICMSRKEDQNHICIPDCHLWQARHMINVISDANIIPIKNQAVFRGSSTGPAIENNLPQRVNFCNKYKDSKLVDAGISNWVGYDEVKEVTKEYLTPAEQCLYKYIININGNATSWDRLPWIMSSNSICVFIKPKKYFYTSWYYPYFQEESPFIFQEEDLIEDYIRTLSIYREKEILAKQKNFAYFFASDVHEHYLHNLLARYQEIQNL